MARKRIARVDFYVDLDLDIRWRVVAANGNIIADSSEGYENAEDAVAGYNALHAAVLATGPLVHPKIIRQRH